MPPLRVVILADADALRALLDGHEVVVAAAPAPVPAPPNAEPAQDAGAAAVLTPREREVAKLIGEGLSNKEIAAALGIQVSTVKNHVHNLLPKMKARRRHQAAIAFERGVAASPEKI